MSRLGLERRLFRGKRHHPCGLPVPTRPPLLVPLALAAVALLSLAGCTAVPASQQQILAKPNMLFDDTNSFAFSQRLLPQSEPGSSTAGSSPGGGCTACR